ncbi:iron complex transport system permease protein [Tamaricihabitans halophyticus]|uniref:Iron complex transport system permease protein n=1 Tax=Tamaricihabitans halophyticus TaxID=1262583 RepID=A0A4R2QWI5_9PSEU|nr:iron complex transport system permease protein [Tamaricihabitans halophyticus]
MVCVVALVSLCLISIAVGARPIGLGEIWQGIVQPGGSEIDAIIRDYRIPRTLLGLLVGVGLGLAGALMQALTRNPLADPGLLGITSGASFGIVFAIAVAGVTAVHGYIWFAFAGALLASTVVSLLGGLGNAGATPVKLAIAGIAMTFLLGSFTSAMVLSDAQTLNRYRFWSAGSLAGQPLEIITQLLPFLVAGTLLALASGPALNSLALGEDVAVSLGHRPRLVRLRGMLAITLLTGAAVALAGPIVFVGLVVPHIARILVGPDQRWLLPTAMLIAPILLLAADVLGRVVARPAEIQIGIIVVFLGVPFFIYLVRRHRLTEL